MKRVQRCWLVLTAAMLSLGLHGVADAQVKYRSGQNVVPIYEGWRRNADGTIDLMFGYLNRNWEEDIFIPVGPDNSITGLPGGPDQGQPTVFFHRYDGLSHGRHQFVFKIRVPKDFSPTQQVIWTLTAYGRTDKVVASLLPVEEADNVVVAENRGGGIVPENKPPTVTVSASSQTTTTSGSVKLTAVFSDDGLPRRPAPRPGATAPARPARGPRVIWTHHRGPAGGMVKFEPPISPITSGSSGTVETGVSFTQPGVYVLRALAEDPALFEYADVTVTVTGSPAGN